MLLRVGIMNSQFLLLFCLGLCVGQTDISGNGESIFKPHLSFLPSYVVPTRSNVTLQCITFMLDAKCAIKKEGADLDPRRLHSVPHGWISKLHLIMGWQGGTDFYLIEIEQSDAGRYTCECHETESRDVLSSEAGLLLVTGRLPKPSLQAQGQSNVEVGGKVTLRCQKPDNMTEYKMFMLLKEGTSLPVRVQSSERRTVDFSLAGLRARDAGKYSCVYHQPGAPFWASHPSDHLEILVLDRNVGQTDKKSNDLLPKPSLSAWPGSVASANSNVTLRCESPIPDMRLVLRKGGVTLDSWLPHHLTERTAEFRLTNLQQGDAGYYTCAYYRKDSPSLISSTSDALFLLVPGYLPKPSLRVLHSGRITTEEKVNLQCEKPHNLTEYKVFALLKEGAPSPVQLLTSDNDTVEFTLQSVTVSDAGKYSCVYLEPEAPFRASHPSDHLAISVAISSSAVSVCYSKTNLIRLGMSAMFVVFMTVFLAEAWYSHRVSPSRPRPYSTPGPP